MVHKLNMNKYVRSLKEEVDKLLVANFIEPCDYPKWLTNVVMFNKANGPWHMSVDFTDMKNACSKETYLLPIIDQLVDLTSGQALMSFMDAFSLCHEINLLDSDRNKLAFITDVGVYVYKPKPFLLKNARVTYHNLVDKNLQNRKAII